MRQPTWPVTARTPGYSSPAINSAVERHPPTQPDNPPSWGGDQPLSKWDFSTAPRAFLRGGANESAKLAFGVEPSCGAISSTHRSAIAFFEARYVQVRQELRRARRYFQASLSILIPRRINLRKSFGRYIEPADHLANAYLMGQYVDRRLVSSLRLQIGCANNSQLLVARTFPPRFGAALKKQQDGSRNELRRY